MIFNFMVARVITVQEPSVIMFIRELIMIFLRLWHLKDLLCCTSEERKCGSVYDSLLRGWRLIMRCYLKLQWVYCWYKRSVRSQTSPYETCMYSCDSVCPTYKPLPRGLVRLWDLIPLQDSEGILNVRLALSILSISLNSHFLSLVSSLLSCVFYLLCLSADLLFTQAWAAPGAENESEEARDESRRRGERVS